MTCVELHIRAAADPQTLPRLVNYVAQLGGVPRHMRAATDDGMMDVVIEPHGLAAAQINIMVEKMRASVLVERVQLRLSNIGELP